MAWPPRDGEAQLRSAQCLTPLDSPAASPSAALESGDNFTDRSPPGTGRSRSDPHGASLRWTHQQPSKVAT
eukprot:9501626-Pyramimonas_sp.AAC.1